MNPEKQNVDLPGDPFVGLRRNNARHAHGTALASGAFEELWFQSED